MIKLLSLFFKDFIIKHKVTYILVCILLAVSLFSVFLISAIFEGLNARDRAEYIPYKCYYMTTKSGTFGDIPDLDNRLHTTLKRINKVSSVELVRFLQDSDQSENGWDVYGMYVVGSPILYLGRTFSKEEIENSQNKVIVSNLRQSSLKVGDVLEYGEEKFDVVGLSFEIRHFLPYNPKRLESTKFDYLDITLKNAPSKKAKDEITNIIKDAFPELDIDPPIESEDNTDPLLACLLFGLFFLTVINILLVYNYIIEQRIKAIKITQICGATKFYCVRLFLLEILAITVAVYIPIAILSTLLMPALLKFVTNANLTYAMSIYSYLKIFAVYIFTIILLFAPKLIKSINFISITEFER